MYLINFKKETEDKLKKIGKTFKDVVCIVFINKNGEERQTSYEQFIQLCDFEYDAGYGEVFIKSIIIVGNDFILFRYEYDGAESWEYKKMYNNNLKQEDITLEDILYPESEWHKQLREEEEEKNNDDRN